MVTEELWLKKHAEKLSGELYGYSDHEEIGYYLEYTTLYRIPYTLRHTRAAELFSWGQAGKGPRGLGDTRAMFESNYAEMLEEHKDRDRDKYYSLFKSRA